MEKIKKGMNPCEIHEIIGRYEKIVRSGGVKDVEKIMPDVMEYLEGDINSHGGYFSHPPLICAADCNENPDVIDLLVVKYGADVHINYDLSVVAHAIYNKNVEFVLPRLLGFGADVNQLDSWGSRPALSYLLGIDENCMRNLDKNKVLELLVKAGADVNFAMDTTRESILMDACENSNDTAIIWALFYYGANPELKDFRGRTALDYARKNKNTKILTAYIKLLREHGYPQR